MSKSVLFRHHMLPRTIGGKHVAEKQLNGSKGLIASKSMQGKWLEVKRNKIQNINTFFLNK